MFRNKLRLTRFYVYLLIVMATLAIVAIFVLRSIFNAVETATKIDQDFLENFSPRLDMAGLDKVYEKNFNKQPIGLDLAE